MSVLDKLDLFFKDELKEKEKISTLNIVEEIYLPCVSSNVRVSVFAWVVTKSKISYCLYIT